MRIKEVTQTQLGDCKLNGKLKGSTVARGGVGANL